MWPGPSYMQGVVPATFFCPFPWSPHSAGAHDPTKAHWCVLPARARLLTYLAAPMLRNGAGTTEPTGVQYPIDQGLNMNPRFSL